MPRSATFLLLHGTFARGARWTSPGSPLRQRIEAESRAAGITANIRAVSWSGRNRTRDRIAAGRELAKILSGIDREVSPKVFLIGHSHGGSAIAHFLVNRRVEGPEVSGCVFLSTPFIAARIRPDAFLTYSSLLAIAAVLGFVFISILLGLMIGGALTLLLDDFWGSNPLAIAVDGIALFLVGFVLRKQPKVYRRLMTRAKIRISANETARAPIPASLLLRASGDEAATALAFGQFIATLTIAITSAVMSIVAGISHFASKLRSSRVWSTVLLALGVFYGFFIVDVIVAAAFGDLGYLWHGAFDWGETFDFPLPFVQGPFNFVLRRVLWMPFAAATTVILLGMGLYLTTGLINALVIWAFGWINFLDAIFAEVSVEPTPFGAHLFHHVEWSDDSHGPLWSRLSHSTTYQSPACLDILGFWLQKLLTVGSPINNSIEPLPEDVLVPKTDRSSIRPC